MNKVGLFLQDVASGLHFVEQYQPRAALLMDASSTQIRYVRDNAPSTEVAWWKHEGDRHWSTTDPEEWAETIWPQIEECPPDYVYYWNEPLWHGALDQFADFDDRQARFIRRMRQLSSGRVKVGAFCFAEGNFTRDGPDIPDNFPKSMDEAEMVFIHEYWKPRLDSPGMVDYHCLRWPWWLEQFERAGRPDLPIAVTECGLTMAVDARPHGEPSGPDVGYLSAEAMAAGVTWQLYRDDHRDYHARCCLEPRVKFEIPFLCSPWAGEWQSFRLDINTELLDYIMTMEAPGAPNGGSMEVYDFDGTERDAVWLKETWGVEVTPSEAQPGEIRFEVKAIRIDEGPCAILNNVKDAGGNPMQNVLVAFHWPGAPDPPESGEPPYTTEVYPWDWHNNFVFGQTNVEGNWAGPMGKGAMVNEGSPGPHSCWIHHSLYKSDLVSGLGWRTGTNHRAPRLEWKAVMTEGNGGDEVELVEKSRETIEGTGSSMLYICFPDVEALIHDRATFAGIEGSGVDLDTSAWERYEDGRGVDWLRSGVCADWEGGTSTRRYWIQAHDLPSVDNPFGPRVYGDFDREVKKHVLVYLGYSEEPEPPPSTNLGDRIRAVIPVLQGIATDADKTGQVVKVIVVYSDDSTVEYKPSLAASIVARARAVLKL